MALALVCIRNLIIMQDEICVYPAVPVTNKTADHKQVIVAQTELDFTVWLQTFVERFVHIPEFDFLGIDIEPLDVIISEEHILLITG